MRRDQVSWVRKWKGPPVAPKGDPDIDWDYEEGTDLESLQVSSIYKGGTIPGTPSGI